MHELQICVQEYSPHIILLTEVKQKFTKDSLADSVIRLEGYELFHNLDSDTECRGVCIFIRDDLKAVKNYHLCSIHFKESVWLDLRLKGQDSLLLGCIYRSPSLDNHEGLVNILRKATELQKSHMLIVGDFNYRHINWDTSETTEGAPQPTSMFLEPTRFREGQVPSVLDLVFTNEEGMISNLNYDPGLGASDHCLLSFDFNCYVQTELSKKTVYNYNKGDYSRMRELCDAIDWVTCLNHSAVQDAWTSFCDQLISIMDICIPKRLIGGHFKQKRNIWMTQEGMAKVREKRKHGKSTCIQNPTVTI